MSDPKPGGSKNMSKSEQEENKELKRKLAKMEAELEEGKKPKIFEDYVLDQETFEVSVKRRLGHFYKKSKEMQDCVSNICKEIEPLIPA